MSSDVGYFGFSLLISTGDSQAVKMGKELSEIIYSNASIAAINVEFYFSLFISAMEQPKNNFHNGVE